MPTTIIVPLEIEESVVSIPFNLESETEQITLTLQAAINVPLEVGETEEEIPFSLETDSILIPLGLQTAIELHADVEYYEGSYEVIPKAFESSVLQTRDKYLTDDVTVTKVPYFEVSNESGKTVYIANEGVIING